MTLKKTKTIQPGKTKISGMLELSPNIWRSAVIKQRSDTRLYIVPEGANYPDRYALM